MEGVGFPGQLGGSEIHGFHTIQDLDVGNIMDEAKTRWLRPNEIHAILCNYKYFTINVKPVNLPSSGTILLFDRKMLRNFRKDGHNWKKKKDGKTVKEAHEHLKVGADERIHVYYAHGQDCPTFVRRCYWLLDKKLEHIVLVHYRDTQEPQNSPATPGNSNSSTISEHSADGLPLEELDSGANVVIYNKEVTDPDASMTVKDHELRLHELNTLDWDDLVTENPSLQVSERPSCMGPQNVTVPGTIKNVRFSNGALPLESDGPVTTLEVQENTNSSISNLSSLENGNLVDFLQPDDLHTHDSFGRWMNYVMFDSPDSVNAAATERSFSSVTGNQLSYAPQSIYTITDIAPAWAFSNEKTKIIITGFFNKGYQQLSNANLFCVCGDQPVLAEFIQVGVYRCLVPPHSPGMVNLFMSFDGNKPVSQNMSFEYRTPHLVHDAEPSSEENSTNEEFLLQMRLAYLLFSTSKCLDISSYDITPTIKKDATKFSLRTMSILKDWAYLLSLVEGNKVSSLEVKNTVFELMLKNRLKDWILERIMTGCKTKEYDLHGQGVIHLCAILGYTWAVELFSWSGLSLDFRDKSGWTALHWAAFCGREKMVAKLLSAGAKANLVTDPTSKNPAGCTAADLASQRGYEGISAYLAEKSLVHHFADMSLAGNISGSLQTTSNYTVDNGCNLSQEDVYLKDSLAAYRTAADAAARIHAAFREHSFKIRSNQIRCSNAEEEAKNIIAAMRIQHAYRNFECKKKMAAAAQIQYRFRTWKMRREFLNLRNQAIKIQAAFRGFQVRRQYRKVVWSVGILEKAILRWRLKRKGFRGFHVKENVDLRQESDTEEDFFRTSRKQAEERLERSVVRVQAMFRSKKAQEEYRSMKLAHDAAQLEYDEEHNEQSDMER